MHHLVAARRCLELARLVLCRSHDRTSLPTKEVNVRSLDVARELLGVDPRADEHDIRRAWRRLARIHHPDAGGDAVRFQQLQAAVDLLLEDPRHPPQATSSPSTGRRAYPSTRGRASSGAVIDHREVDTSILADNPPVVGQAWDVASLSRAVAAHLAGEPEVALMGVSRRPGSRLNRYVRHLSDDLLSSWRIQSASRRGVAGHDLEVVAKFPSSGRRQVDRSTPPSGWSTVRHPSTTESSCVIHPGQDDDSTAVLAAMAVDGFCTAIAWPLTDWRVPA